MLHLFKKIYLDIDENLNTFRDRIVISKNHGYRVSSDLENSFDGKLFYFSLSLEELIGENKTFSSFVDMMNQISLKLEERNKPIVIYSDSENFLKILINWYKLVLKEPKCDECYSLLKSYSFKENLFSNGRMRISHTQYYLNFEKNLFDSLFEIININKTEKENFVKENKKFFSIEFLLASYLFDGSSSEEVKKILKVLIKKDLEKYFYEIKEILLVHLLRKAFQQKLQTTKVYDFSNFYDIVNDESPLVKVFFKKEIWNNEGLFKPSTSGNIKFENITDDDIDNFIKFTEISGEEWEEENFYRFNKSDKYKLTFLKHITKDVMTDEELKEIIDFELKGNHAAGTFYSIDLETVNHYFIDFVLNCVKENTKEKFQYYCV
jgi:hypothetical protein